MIKHVALFIVLSVLPGLAAEQETFERSKVGLMLGGDVSLEVAIRIETLWRMFIATVSRP